MKDFILSEQTRETSTFQKRATQTSCAIRGKGLLVRQISEIMCVLHLKYGYCSYKNAWICYSRLYSPPGAVLGTFHYGRARALFDVFWTVEQKHPMTALTTLGIARTILI